MLIKSDNLHIFCKYFAMFERPLIVVYNLGCAALNMYIGIELFVTQRNMTYRWAINHYNSHDNSSDSTVMMKKLSKMK
jgi:hypothetical protein